MHNIKATVPFLQVADMEKSLVFYVEKLGFEIEHSWTPNAKIEWCQLKRDAGCLMLQENKKMQSNNAPIDQKIGVSIYFICQDCLEIYEEITAKGMEASEPFVSNRMWLTSIIDPDGYEINFESATDVAIPEETKLSEWKNQT